VQETFQASTATFTNESQDVVRIRPTWTDYFLGLAFLASRRSQDPTTQHGCVLVDSNNHILGTGYNSYPSNMSDEFLPKERPSDSVPMYMSKYAWMEHAEVNALANMPVSAWSHRPVTAYVTGTPCFACSKALCRHAVTNWVVAERRGFTTPAPGEAENTAGLIREKGVSIFRVVPDLRWMVDDRFVEELRGLGFLGPFS
jgi:dCMP deaminase